MDYRSQQPVLEGVPVSSPTKSAEEKAKYFSVLFRPWSLTHNLPDIPHLCSPGLTRVHLESKVPAAKRRRILSKETPSFIQTFVNLSSFTQAWDEYVSGHVVSDHAR